MRPLMVVLLVDALGWRLAGARPGFADVLDQRREIGTILGFSSGALPTIFTGRLPREHGRWLMYRRADGPTPFAGFGALRWLPPRVRRSWRFSRWLTARVGRSVHGYFNLYEVPVEELDRFDLAERADIFAPGGLPIDSLWDGLARERVAWRTWSWRTPEAQALDEAHARIRGGDEDLLFVYSADLDALLHHQGTSGEGVRARMDRYDAWVREAFALAGRRGRPLWLYLCSDHGMVDVVETVDVMSRVRALPVRPGRDYVAFYDSTMARFWWQRPGARAVVRDALAAEPRGRWIDAAELAREGADVPGHVYGDDVWLVRPGALVLPSYMGSAPVAAMHGYDAAHPDMTALLASNRPLPGDVRHLVDLRGFWERELAAARAEAA